MIFSKEQAQSFKDNGYLIVRDMMDSDFITNLQKRFTDHYGDLQNPANWDKQKEISDPVYDEKLPETHFDEQPEILRAVHQLGKGKFRGGSGGTAAITWPNQDAEWDFPASGHLDGYPRARWWPFMLAITAYLSDVDSHGGCFTYWPGSHLNARDYFRDNPEKINGSFLRWEPGYDSDPRNWKQFMKDIEPREFTGKAGDVIFWHSWLFHTGSVNCNPSPRVGLFARYSCPGQYEARFEIPNDMWGLWGI